MNKPQTLQGFRDFLPNEKRKRDFVTKKIVEVFERFGFEPLETPTLEYASLLLGKYGTEADKLVYTFKDKGNREVGLRYDQTVPTARVIAQNQNPDVLPKILRRYQIQNVFRAERPQKGRYREFTQCDIDIFASKDPISDAEILACTYFAYKNIGFKNVYIALNDRETLFNTLRPFSSEKVSVFSIIQSLDKLGKISEGQIIQELISKGLEEKTARVSLQSLLSVSPSEQINTIQKIAVQLGVNSSDLPFTSTLARGLDYYTGMIFEVFAEDYSKSSLGGGGRYDNLIEQLCGVNLPAVGMAIGFDRTVEAADQLNLIPSECSTSSAKVLVTVFEETLNESLTLTKKLRENDINTEIFGVKNAKLDKQLKYADKKNIPYVVILGPEEVKENKFKLKNMKERKEYLLTEKELLDKFSINF